MDIWCCFSKGFARFLKTMKTLFAIVMAGLLALGALGVDAARQRQTELQNYLEEKQADERVESLQPEDIIRVCGKPFSDTRPIYGRRQLKYKTRHVDPRRAYFPLEFRSDGARWQFQPNPALLIVHDHVDWAFKIQFPCVSDAARKYGKTLAQRYPAHAAPRPPVAPQKSRHDRGR